LEFVRARGAEGVEKVRKASPLFEIARLLVRFDHLARFIVNANHSAM
jgi:hypothetical protein